MSNFLPRGQPQTRSLTREVLSRTAHFAKKGVLPRVRLHLPRRPYAISLIDRTINSDQLSRSQAFDTGDSRDFRRAEKTS
jgi:hypothetical protein